MILLKRYKNSPGWIHRKDFIVVSSSLIILISLQLLTTINIVNATSEIASDQIDPKLKNIKLIGNKIIPDVSTIIKLENHDESNDDEDDDDDDDDTDDTLNDVKHFILAGGFKALELDGYKIRRDIPFTLIIPKIDMKTIDKSRLKDIMLEHIVPGKIFDEFIDNDNDDDDNFYGNSIGHKLKFHKLSSNVWAINEMKILQTIKINENLATITIDGFLGDRKTAFAKRNIQETNRYNEPQRLEMKNVTTKNEPTQAKEIKLSPLMTFLSSMKSGTKVFQHFLAKSNLTQVMDDGHYTILIPSDNAFQRWHPIDWGFYPFSVQEFTENVMRNHFLQSPAPLRMNDVRNSNKLIYKTLGGESVVFKNNPSPSVNNVSILGDYTLPNGNQIFIISEVLFVSEAVVSKLHQMHKDKETPPLLAFPWFGAQFLSHSFLALERDPRFTQITRYMNNAEIAPYVSGANYTFFVPEDEAFERIGFDLISDDILASPKGVKMLLNHFVKGRLYDRDLKDNEVFETIGGGVIKIQRKPGSNVTVNLLKITESEIFVYNLGTMFYIDGILYSDILGEFAATSNISPSSTQFSTKLTTTSNGTQTQTQTQTQTTEHQQQTTNVPPSDVEIVPNQINTPHITDKHIPLRHDDSNSDDEDDDDEIITPKALPVRFN